MKLVLKPIHGVAVITLLLIILVLFTGSSLFYFMLISIIVTQILMFGIVKNSSEKMFQFLKLSENTIESGESLDVEITSNNNSIFPITHAKVNCVIYSTHHKIDFPPENLFFNSFQSLHLNDQVQINNRGLYNKSVVITDIYDPLKIFKKTVLYERSLSLIVYPRVVELSYFSLPPTGYIGTRKVAQSSHEDYSSLRKVRPYNHGDSMKRVHWKLSSKHNELFVKEYDSTSSTKLYIFMDAYQVHYKDDVNRVVEDTAVEIAASISKYALKEKAELELYYEMDQVIKVESRDLATFPNILNELVAFMPLGERSFSDIISQETKRLEQGSFVVLITPVVNEDLINTILGLKRRSFVVRVIVVGENSHKDLLESLGVIYDHITPGDDLKEKLEVMK